MKQGGVSRYLVKDLLSHSTEKLRRGTFLCFTKFLVSEKTMDKRGGRKEYHDILSIFLSDSTEKLRRGTFLFFKKFLVSKNFMDERLGMKEGGVSRYSVKNCLSHSTEKLPR